MKNTRRGRRPPRRGADVGANGGFVGDPTQKRTGSSVRGCPQREETRDVAGIALLPD